MQSMSIESVKKRSCRSGSLSRMSSFQLFARASGSGLTGLGYSAWQ
jgi:hypothetical protein